MQALYIEQSPYIISIVYWTVHPIIGISVHQCRQPYLWPTHSPSNEMAVTIWTVHPQSTMSWNLAKCRLPETWLLSRQIVLSFCTRHGSNTAVLCAKFQEGQSTKISKRDFANSQFKVYLVGLSIFLRPQINKINHYRGSLICHNLSLDILNILKDICHFQVCDEETKKKKKWVIVNIPFEYFMEYNVSWRHFASMKIIDDSPQELPNKAVIDDELNMFLYHAYHALLCLKHTTLMKTHTDRSFCRSHHGWPSLTMNIDFQPAVFTL